MCWVGLEVREIRVKSQTFTLFFSGYKTHSKTPPIKSKTSTLERLRFVQNLMSSCISIKKSQIDSSTGLIFPITINLNFKSHETNEIFNEMKIKNIPLEILLFQHNFQFFSSASRVRGRNLIQL